MADVSCSSSIRGSKALSAGVEAGCDSDTVSFGVVSACVLASPDPKCSLFLTGDVTSATAAG